MAQAGGDNSGLNNAQNSAVTNTGSHPGGLIGAPTTTAEQLKLSPSPDDGITAVKFQPGRGAQFLVAAGWDCFVRLYDCAAGGQRACYQHTSPVLSACFTDAGHTVSGSAVGDMKLFDINAGASNPLGKCDRGISSIHYSETIQSVLTGSWDCTVRIWDPRAPGQSGRSVVTAAAGVGAAQLMAQAACSATGAQSQHIQPAPVYTLDTVRHNLVVGTAQRHVLIWDLRQMNQPIEQRESNLRFQTRCIRCFPNGQGYVLSSIEGRVAVEMFDPSPEVQKKKYAFKCHRLKEGDRELIHPVTAIAFHQGYNTFATAKLDPDSLLDLVLTRDFYKNADVHHIMDESSARFHPKRGRMSRGLWQPEHHIKAKRLQYNGIQPSSYGGCDGFVNIWDGFNRKRLAQLHRFHTSIASLDFSDDGTQLAIAAAYMYENGQLENQPESALFVRSILDHEVKPKHLNTQQQTSQPPPPPPTSSVTLAVQQQTVPSMSGSLYLTAGGPGAPRH